MATWLPIAVRSVLHQCSVKWMDFGSKTLDEPFFDYTLQTLFDLQPPPDQRITPLRDLIAAASGVPRTEPAGLVLHISRCGSTVVVRALQAMSNVLVMSEVSPLLSLFSPPPLVDGRAPYSSQEREQAIRAVVTLFAAHSRASAVVIKAHATSLLHIDYIRALWPGVPVLILIRDPVEVVVSNYLRPGTWVRDKPLPLGCMSQFGWSADVINEMNTAEYLARAIAIWCDTARRQMDSDCYVLDYADLCACNLTRIGRLFGLPRSSRGALSAVMSRDAKDPSNPRPFTADAEQKRARASPDMLEAVDRWALGPYHSLKQYARWKRCAGQPCITASP